jgi:hypothetical protein
MRSRLLVGILILSAVSSLAEAAPARRNAGIEHAVSITELTHGPGGHDRDPITVRAELANMFPHEPLLRDLHCKRGCHDVVGFDVPDAIANRPDIKSLTEAMPTNERKCFVQLRVRPNYDQPPNLLGRPRAPLRLSRLEVVQVAWVRCYRHGRRVSKRASR